MDNSKAINAIKKVRAMEDEHYKKAVFCREYNMELDAIKHTSIESALRKVSSMLQNEFETGYVRIEGE